MRNFKRSYCGEISEDFGDYGGSSQGISGLREVQMGLFWGFLGGKRGFFSLFLGFFGFFRKKVKNYLVMCTKPCIFISETNTHTQTIKTSNHANHKNHNQTFSISKSRPYYG